MGSKKKYEFQQKSFFSGQTLCWKKYALQKKYGFPKKRNSYFWAPFCRYFFSVWIEYQLKQKKVPAKSVFPCTSNRTKSTGKKIPKSMSSFFLTHTCFGAHTFFGTLFGPKKYEFLPFLELILCFGPMFFSAQYLEWQDMSSFFWGNRIF